MQFYFPIMNIRGSTFLTNLLIIKVSNQKIPFQKNTIQNQSVYFWQTKKKVPPFKKRSRNTLPPINSHLNNGACQSLQKIWTVGVAPVIATCRRANDCHWYTPEMSLEVTSCKRECWFLERTPRCRDRR